MSSRVVHSTLPSHPLALTACIPPAPRPGLRGAPRLARTLTAVVSLAALSGCGVFRGTPEPGIPAPRGSRVEITSTADLVREMRERYDGKWYRTLTFLQNNTRFTTDGREEKSQWMEYVSVPGKLRIEFLPRASRSGILFTNGRAYTFEGGSRIATRRQIHPLLLLTSDVYVLPPSVTLRRLDSLGVRRSRFREDRWGGRRVYVVGAAAGDTLSSQFWVDADRLLLVRWIERQGTGARRASSDTRLGAYKNIDGHAVPTEITVYRGGRPVFKEAYADVRVNVPFSPSLFEPARWRNATHPDSR